MSLSKAIKKCDGGNRRWRIGAFAVLMVAGLLIVLSSSASAQDYQELPLNPDVPTWYQLGSREPYRTFPKVMTGEEAYNQQAFDTFFNDTVFPLFTQWRERPVAGKSIAPLVDAPFKGGPAGMRAAFKAAYANARPSASPPNPAIHEELNKLTLAKMEQIAAENYHPVVRVNAMLLIGDLTDTIDPNSGPWKQALPALLKSATANDTLDAVRVEALRGLLRHAQAGFDNDTRQKVVTGMLALLQQHIPPNGRNQDVHDWISRRAIDVLAAIGDPGANGKVVQTLLGMVDDQKASTSIRTAAAAALAKIKYTPPKDFNSTGPAKSLGKLAVDCNTAELAAAAAQHSPIVVDRLKQRLHEIRQGLVGADGKSGVMAWSTAPDQQKLITLIDGQIDNLAKMCATKPDMPKPVDPAQGQQITTPIPVDTQKPIATALKTAGDALQNVLEKGDAAPAAGAEASPLGLN